jgi:hypothetical protein
MTFAAQLEKCISDTGAYYKIAFEPAQSDRPNEYHHLEIRVAKPGLMARARQEYYSRPWRVGNIGVEFEEAGMSGNGVQELSNPKFDASYRGSV